MTQPSELNIDTLLTHMGKAGKHLFESGVCEGAAKAVKVSLGVRVAMGVFVMVGEGVRVAVGSGVKVCVAVGVGGGGKI